MAVICACTLCGIGTDARAGNEPESQIEQGACVGWGGSVAVGPEHTVRAVVAEASLGNEAILAGALKRPNEGGMVFVGSVADSSFLSMTWRGELDTTRAPMVLWSDGHCEHLDMLERDREVPLSGAAPWIWSSLPSGWQGLLPLVAKSQAADPFFASFVSSLAELTPEREPGAGEAAVECSWVWTTEGAPPKIVQSQLESLASRYLSTLERLQSVDRLRGQ